MTIEVLIPTYLQPQDEESTLVDDGTVVFRPMMAQGVTQRNSMAEPRLRVKQTYANLSGAERSALISALRRAQGKAGTIRAIVGYNRRGSFPVTELAVNGTFGSGTTGWQASPGNLSVADRRLRVTLPSNPSSGLAFSSTVSVTTVQYAPYAVRMVFIDGSYALSNGGVSTRVGDAAFGTTNGFTGTSSTVQGLVSASGVVRATAMFPGFGFFNNNGIAGQFTDLAYISMARCALVDNGQNLIVRSDELDNINWALARATVSANGLTAPDGTSTADYIVEDTTATQTHGVTQQETIGSGVADYTVSVALKASTRTWAQLQMVETTGSTSANAYFNLSTGAVGTITNGANWSNGRAVVVDLGGGWYQCTITARKTNAATVVDNRIFLATGDLGNTYTGDGASKIAAWRVTTSQSSVPGRLAQTLGTATTSAGTSQTGSSIYLKGLPASTSGLLLPDDLVQIGDELKQVTGSLDSNAAGLGLLQFSPGLFRSPSDGDPVIVHQPMGKFILAGDASWRNNLGAYADVDLELEHIYE